MTIAVLIMFVPAVAASKLARDMILTPKYKATATNKTAKIITDSDAKENQPKLQKPLRHLVVVPSPADGFLDDLDGYVEPDPYKNHPAVFVSSKVPTIRKPPYMNIFIHKHHITSHMKKGSLMSKFNTVPDQDLDEIEKALDINI